MSFAPSSHDAELAALSEIARDVTEKWWYFDFFHDTELAAPSLFQRAARSAFAPSSPVLRSVSARVIHVTV